VTPAMDQVLAIRLCGRGYERRIIHALIVPGDRSVAHLSTCSPPPG
jgi:hypothetical protein